MELLEEWGGVALGLVLLAVLLRGALLEVAREPRRDESAGPLVDVRLVVLMVLVLATLGPRLVSLLT